jgi:UDP-N-acetyl-D-galactosamine dehydrogenase
MQTKERIAVIGLGYVGLPVALAMSRRFPTLGFDINSARIEALRRGVDHSGETSKQELEESSIVFTDRAEELTDVTFFIVAVPTPIDAGHSPDLTPVTRASEVVGKALRAGSVVVYESTVYPGVTEDICGPILARVSGLRQGVDFKLGYSPERINPGDKQHTFDKIVKVVSAEDEPTLARVAGVYESVVSAGIYKARSIKVAEAAKAIENIQRDLNVALMNELALIFNRVGIRTKEVLDAAATKWNFLRFEPGLVGGHCIGVDPYYMTTLAEQLGYHPEVILAGRRVNESMGGFIAARTVKLLAERDVPLRRARVGVLGLTFKPNVRDLRNTKVVDIIAELSAFGVGPLVFDPLVDPEEAKRDYGVLCRPWPELVDLDAMILAVPHQELLDLPRQELFRPLKPGGILVDVKAAIQPAEVPDGCTYWSL